MTTTTEHNKTQTFHAIFSNVASLFTAESSISSIVVHWASLHHIIKALDSIDVKFIHRNTHVHWEILTLSIFHILNEINF